MSDTKNVKLGVCRVFFGGVDLGYTQGGVDVEVKTDTHEVVVDQFGKGPINEIIMGRTVTAKVPMAETTLDNLVRIMPGATLVETGAAKASGTLTVAALPVANDTIKVGGVTFTFKAVAVMATDIAIGATVNAQASAIATAINSIDDPSVNVQASATNAVVTLTANQYGTGGTNAYLGNNIALASTGAGVTVSGATLSGGLDATKKKVVVPTGIGTDLLSLAKQLVLHPQANADTNRDDDFVIPLAATAGDLQFAYNLDKERIFNATFKGYPDPATQTLYIVGDPAAA